MADGTTRRPSVRRVRVPSDLHIRGAAYTLPCCRHSGKGLLSTFAAFTARRSTIVVVYSFPAPSRLTSSSPGKPKEYSTPLYFFGKKAS